MMKSFAVRPTQVRSSGHNPKQDPLSSSPNTTALMRPSETNSSNDGSSNKRGGGGGAVPGPTMSLHQRHFTMGSGGSDASSSSMFHRKTPTPPIDNHPTILSVLNAEEQQSLTSSPGTPPKKLWERQYGSFLRNRVRSNQSLVSDAGQHQTHTPPSPPKDGSVRGGKLFANVFRGSGSGTDELDGTLRRGSDKTYSPRSGRSLKFVSVPPSSVQSSETTDTLDSRSVSSHASLSATTSTLLKPRLSGDEVSVLHHHAAGTTTSSNTGEAHYASSLGMSGSTSLLPAALLPPRTLTAQQQSQFFKLQHELFPDSALHNNGSGSGATRSPTILMRKTDKSTTPSIIPTSKAAASKASSSSTKSSALKKAFTDFHNTSDDANSAFLGDDPSMSGRALGFARKNERLVEVRSATSSSHSHNDITNSTSAASSSALTVAPLALKPSKSHGQIPQVDDDDSVDDQRKRRSCSITHNSISRGGMDNDTEIARTSTRILKSISGVDAWQTGRRYLIAPAVLAACPGTALSFLFGKDTTRPQTVDQVVASSSYDPFATIVLGECLLTYVTQKSAATMTVKQWSTALLVLRQNYLLEYNVGDNISTSIPRGYAHLQFATTVRHDHFHDALELHFFGSPCAKEDARILMIRISATTTMSPNNCLDATAASSTVIDDAVSNRPRVRDAWQTCLNRASQLAHVSDLYEYDDVNVLGKGQYAEVRAARRRRPNDSNGPTVVAAGAEAATVQPAPAPAPSNPPRYDCALKIFDKNKFWRMVIKGRERADTIVRETSVQATLLAVCEGQQYNTNSSFLRLRGFFETSEQVVLELELLEGTDLFQYIVSKSTVQEAEAAVIMRDVLSCLDVMSKNGMAHRDVKPANILMCNVKPTSDNSGQVLAVADSIISTNPRVKIGDFGMAAFVGIDGQVRGRCGTPGYVAPEIFTAGAYGGYGNKVDVFSAGVTLYVMLCGYEPFYGETDDELKEANKAAAFDFPTDEWSTVSAEAIDLVKQMMQVDPAKRLNARQALEHPWFVQNLVQCDKASVAPPLASSRDDACRVS